ncbi:hypothetical protein HYS48_00600 [Candidatus Woesearchaeota archaeon]|nr:hypothetical protein [Candidatus Woesearchaeota archaeon]
MKHTWQITLLLVGIFFLAQVIGLVVIQQYIDPAALQQGKIEWGNLPLNIERPQMEESKSFAYLFTAIILGTLLFLLLIKIKAFAFWKLWFFLAVFITLSISFHAFLPQVIAVVLALILGFYKIFKPNLYIHNLTELFVYGGLAVIFVPVLNLLSVSMLLLLISLYDMFAVWKSKHMIKLAKFQAEMKIFAGLFIPYQRPVRGKLPATEGRRVKSAVLGGGDIGFPLLFGGVVLKGLLLQHPPSLALLYALLVPTMTALALLFLLLKAREDRFYPAMPFLMLGCFVGYGFLYLLQ